MKVSTQLNSLPLKSIRVSAHQYDTPRMEKSRFHKRLALQDLESIRQDYYKKLEEWTKSTLPGANSKEAVDRIKQAIQTTSSERLDLSELNLSTLPPFPNGLLDHITILRINNNTITSIPTHAFKGLGNLQKINLSFNKITSILSDAFFGLDHLETLDISVNKITSIQIGAFSGLRSLHLLHLNYNQIESLQPDMFRDSENLKILHLHNNKLSSIPTSAINGLRKLENLYLHHNRIRSIQANAFMGLENLKKLDLSINKIASIQTDAFNGLDQLDHLNLNYNRLASIQTNAFNGLRNLTKLLLAYNETTSIQENAFMGLEKLKFLDLNNNQITLIQTGVFDRFQNLQHLDLSSNQISRVEPTLFSSQSILDVNLESNRLAINTANALTTWNAGHPNGLFFQMSVYELSAAPLPHSPVQLADTLNLWLSPHTKHPLWAYLISNKPDQAVHLATVLQRMHNDCPRQSNGKVEHALAHTMSHILKTMEFLFETDQPLGLQKFLEVAESSVGTCIDKVKVGYMRMQVLCAQFKPGTSHEKQLEAEQTYKKMDRVLNFVSDVSVCGIVWDSASNTFVNLETMVEETNKGRNPDDLLSTNQSEESTLSLGEFYQRVILSANGTGNRYQMIHIGDQAEDILKIMNEMFTNLHRVDMRFEGCCTLGKDPVKLKAAINYIDM